MFILQIGDEKINAHRSVLAQNSKVFYKMFEQKGMIEAQNVRKKLLLILVLGKISGCTPLFLIFFISSYKR
uniref:BTB domain-containing protein n=1 Tax=Meloidogyne incognita TaxID=6306 RepID=A0A914KYS1_MELIC